MKITTPDQISWFRHSSVYINAHRNRVFVILLTGEALADDNLPNIIHDISLLHSLGVKLVLVHGARPQITAALRTAGCESRYHRNLRITEPGSIRTIKETVGALGIDIEALFSMGLANTPLEGADINVCRGNFITAKPYGIHDGIDFAHTGLVRKVDAAAITAQLERNNVVLINNLGYSTTGEVFNLSAEEVATETAIALRADKMILFIPADGVKDNEGHLVSSLSPADAEVVIAAHKTSEDQDQQCVNQALSAAVRACKARVHRSHLISYRRDGALLQELFTREGQGSLVSADTFEELRKANIDDVGGILELIKPLEDSAVLVQRSRELLETEIGNFRVISYESMIIACAALYPLDEHSAEIACIAIHDNYQKNGRGDRLLACLEAEARKAGMDRIFVLTTVAMHWFLEREFVKVDIGELPAKKQQFYNYQRNSQVLCKKLDGAVS
ncbi:MAG: amino-acid N-acetyltransferase [Pseudohongiellaceae bacterium]